MSRIAIVKVRSAHDLEWQPPAGLSPMLRLFGFGAMVDHMESTAGQAFMPQLTLPYLAGLGHEYNRIHGTNHTFTLLDAAEADLLRWDFDQVWFTATTPNAPATYRVSDRVRALGIPTVLGGIHPSTLPDEAAPHADSLALGEGEAVVPEILADLDAGRPPRLRYFGGRTTCLERLPVPAWRDSLLADYCPWIVPVQTSRGCRNACAFCSTTRYQGAARRHRPVAEIVDEIRVLKAQGILTPDKTVFFTDNNIVSDTDHRSGIRDTRYARALFEALVPLEISWVGQGEIAVGEDPDLVALMARSGCFLLLIGLESVSQGNLDRMGKGGNQVGRYIDCLETLHGHGIANIGCFIFGLDEDGPEVFDATEDFVSRYVDVPQLSLLTPFPGTPLFRRMKAEGRLLHEDWSRYDITHVVFRPSRMSPEQLEDGYHRLMSRVYGPLALAARAFRYAATPVPDRPQMKTFLKRFMAMLAPNLVYRRLGAIGREDNRAELSDGAVSISPQALTIAA